MADQRYLDSEKLLKNAISIVLFNEDGKTLFVLRSRYKSSYPSTWSLPSYFVNKNETFSDTIKRIGINKLDCELEKVCLLKKGKFEREKFILYMYIYQVKLISGKPKVNTSDYEKIKWENANYQFQNMKIFGACTTLYRNYLEKTSYGQKTKIK